MINKIIASVIVLALISAVVAAVKACIRRKEIRKFYNSAEHFSDIQKGRNMRLSYYLAKSFNMIQDESTIIGAELLEMIQKGCIEPKTAEKTDFMGRVKKDVSLRIISEPEDEFLKSLYEILKAAAGADGVLQKGEMTDYCGEHPHELRNIIKGAEANGRD
ncbi:MAG: hypothetical protein PUB42_03920 [Firmicutes bacterium]|nr:hypothetical protein [Bacillota bacterium]